MKISQASAKPKPIEVQFGEAVLHVEYKPLSYTVREMEELVSTKDVKQIVETMKRVVHKWDLTDDDEAVLPVDHPYAEDGSVKDDDPLMDIPSHIFTEILRKVTEDQKPSGEASRPSVAS